MEDLPQIIGICSGKGGVGKTTTTASMSALLANMNYSVLVVDLDARQASMSKYYKYREYSNNDSGLFELLTGTEEPLDCISKTNLGELHVITNFNKMIKHWMSEKSSNILKLKQKLEVLRDYYDFIFIDCPGNFNLLNDAGIIASDLLIVPIEPTRISAIELNDTIFPSISEAQEFRMGNTVDAKIFINKTTHSNGSKSFQKSIRESSYDNYDFSIEVLDTHLPDYQCFKDSSALQEPVHLMDKRAASMLISLSKEIFPALIPQLEEIDKFDDFDDLDDYELEEV